MRSTAVFALLLGIFAAFAAAWSKEGTYSLLLQSHTIGPLEHPALNNPHTAASTAPLQLS